MRMEALSFFVTRSGSSAKELAKSLFSVGSSGPIQIGLKNGTT